MPFPSPALLCPFWEVSKPGSFKDALGQSALCLGKVKFEVTGKIMSDTPNQQSSHSVSTLLSLCPVWVIKQPTREETFPSPNFIAAFTCICFLILSFCFWLAGVEVEGSCALSPRKLSLRTTELGLQLAQHLLYYRCFMHLYYSLMLSVAL